MVTSSPFSFPTLLLFIAVLLIPGLKSQAQWLDWQDETATRLVLTSVANSDDEEKDQWPADLNKDGFMDLVVVRKEP
ncbi:MAG: hypothetical protein OEW26_07170, partial [Nitrospirota bacterium]|nr:hypothetical protein [Nitrospirota bacterium]